MNYRIKSAFYSFLLFTITIIGCSKPTSTVREPMLIVEGRTMGTTYHITYFDEHNRNFKVPIDSLLLLVNKSISTYDSSSEVSLFNKATSGSGFNLPHFFQCIKIAQEVFIASHGAFDPTVMPLVNAWGFGPAKQTLPDSAYIDSLLAFVGFENIRFNADSIWKLNPYTQVDFGGIGQGYGADVITHFLKQKGIKNMLVELGGEGMACGINLKSNKPWLLGILNPNSTEVNQFLKAQISVQDRSYSTAGSYFNYREVNGIKYVHTIHPRQGYPVLNELLSVSVFAADCATADAWDTALMVMGKDEAIATLKQHPELDAFLIFSTSEGLGTFATPDITSDLKIIP